MRHNKTKQLLDYWLALFNESNVSPPVSSSPIWPDRSSIQPVNCRSLLGDMFILESLGGATRYRLAGTNLCGLYGRELKREEFSKVFDAQDRRSAESWVSRLSEDKQVVLICSIAETDNEEHINLETLLLPLSNSGGTGKRVLGITVSQDAGSMRAYGPIMAQTIRSVRALRPWETMDNDIDRKTSANFISATGSRRIGGIRPPSMTTTDTISVSESDSADISQSHKRVGHLLVIDGGLSKD